MGATYVQPPPQKPIRFVNTEGQPPVKRRRVNAACRTCRKRKTRCDGTRPVCTTCTHNGHGCLGYADSGEDIQSDHIADGIDNGRNDNTYRREKSVEAPNVRDSIVEMVHKRANSDSHQNKRPGSGPRPERVSFSSNIDGDAGSDRDSLPDIEARLPLIGDRNRVPYFRYFGPTAIVPGFKQMVVSVREHGKSTGTRSSISASSAGLRFGDNPLEGGRGFTEMPVYDPSSSLPVSPLITHLVETFFAHLGCNYPFLRKSAFILDVEAKSVEPILVDAVCALAARFSDHQLIAASNESAFPKSEYGQVFAQRAKAAVVDTFPCPTVAAVQACLLLAYEGFGAGQDSALWMYLGCAIRMAIDLGLQKIDGVKHQGLKDPGYRSSVLRQSSVELPTGITEKQRRDVEQERTDTLWTVFMLDRVISSGTGRPATIKDDDVELSFPNIQTGIQDGWPSPFPALIRIIHLYGRVADLLNNIKSVQDVTPKKVEALAGMEKDLTLLYQRLDQRLTFNATNFQHYCKSGEGTNFILLHFWFHTLIMLLHQPTLMHSFEGPIHQLLPNSRELSMSSAKTIADILSFAELIDIRSFIGNPFTSQPMYIAACAFLMESAAQSSSVPSSRVTTPPGQKPSSIRREPRPNATREQKQRHSLLVSAANQNYQRCYKALQQLEAFWAGTRYILVALDQKAKGIWDPETYTEQEYESTKVHNSIPNWRSKLPMAAQSPGPSADFRSPRNEMPDPIQAIGWSVTGTTNSSSSNLTLMYPAGNQLSVQPSAEAGPAHMAYDPIRGSLPDAKKGRISISNTNTNTYAGYMNNPPYPSPAIGTLATNPVTASDAQMLLELQGTPFIQRLSSFDSAAQNMVSAAESNDSFPHGPSLEPPNNNFLGMGSLEDMMMETQEIDMTAIDNDLMPWLEYLPRDVLNFFDVSNTSADISHGADGTDAV